ncbi:DExH-box ATP-dependent RNA helicase DExH3 isoform X1 [Lolium perenne]|uniref:DExH-box ATP-dependent RNA helicase DExH3 isoform X1 n=1 Tax=Lolium perenne TaxID=4522 RepID=UPI0021F51E55|nr:DExH-box ATP-dependent RNA helicase DExH3-like isoform X2 [Lolium perenne]
MLLASTVLRGRLRPLRRPRPPIMPAPLFLSQNPNPSASPAPASMSSTNGVYVPPMRRLRSVIASTSGNLAPPPSVQPAWTPDWRADGRSLSPPSPPQTQRRSAALPPRPPPQRQPQTQPMRQQSAGYSRYAYDDFSEEESDREMDRVSVSSSSKGASTLDNVDEWKWKLHMLLRNDNEQEIMSRERKDRRDFDQLAQLAERMGLHSRQYARIIVFSKVPLPNYRSDLDDKRPQREVSIPSGLQREVDALLADYLARKRTDSGNFPNAAFSRSSSTDSFMTDEGFYEQQDNQASTNVVMERIQRKKSLQLRNQQAAWQESNDGQSMMEFRRSLPANKERQSLLEAISQNQVVVVSGETGCGKTTQLPQYILESEIEAARGATCSIICTQPRRISAISVSERVAAERGEKIGESVGYKVRLEGMRGRDTRLLFCTTGVLLRRLLGFTYPVRSRFLEDILEVTGHRLTPYNQIDDYGQEKSWKMQKQALRKTKTQIASVVEDAVKTADLRDYSPQTRDSLSCWNPDSIGFNLIENVLCHICQKERAGAVLVFMTGWDDINTLKEQLQSNPLLGDPSKVLLLACHGSMASAEQKLIFDKPEPGVRKIVLATNLAETSITINDVVFVVDCGKAKETSYDALNNTPCLLPTWISKASARQRRGRAGRVQSGECFHLYPQCVYNVFADYQLPELLRTPLQSLCLQIKSLRLGSISEFLSRALQSPESLSVQNAIDYLKVIGAFDQNEELTVLGKHLSMLPVEPKLGKMLIFGAIFNCLDPILTIVSGLSVRDPFMTPFDKKDLAESAKLQFSCREYSDHLAIVHAYDGWREAERDRNGYDYCWRNFLSAQTLKALDSLRRQFIFLLKDTGLIDENMTMCNKWSRDANLVRAVICAGLYPGVSSVVNKEKSVSLKTMEDGQVMLYSSSVNGKEGKIPFPWLVFNEKVKVNSVFLRDSTAISDSTLLLFGGNIQRGGLDGHLKMLGGYLEFFMSRDLASTYLNLKNELENLIHHKLQNPRMDIQTSEELLSAVRLLVTEDPCSGRFVYGRQEPRSKKAKMMLAPASVSMDRGGGHGGDNPKNQLQTLLTRAGNDNPTYKTKQIKNSLFRSTVEFNGMEFVGQPCANKKLAEKDAAGEAINWLTGGGAPPDTRDARDMDHMSMLTKPPRRKRHHHRRS